MADVQHILTDAIGGSSDPGVTVEHFVLLDDDAVLLCTNGLTDVLEDEAIAEVLAQRRSPNEQCELLVDMALAKGTEDNTTVVLAQYEIP